MIEKDTWSGMNSDVKMCTSFSSTFQHFSCYSDQLHSYYRSIGGKSLL